MGLSPVASQRQIDNDQAKRNFVYSIRSAKTLENYRRSLGYFMNFLKVSTDDYASLLQDEPLLIQSRIVDFIIYCRDVKKLSPATVHVNVAAIKHFYNMNEVELKWKKIHSFEGQSYRVIEDRAYTHEEIRKMVSVASIRDKALILLLASTGMRLGAVPPLQIKDLTEVDYDGYKLYQIEVYKRYKESYKTYCTPECKKAIDDYLDFRKRCSERITDNTPLFRKLLFKQLTLFRLQFLR